MSAAAQSQAGSGSLPDAFLVANTLTITKGGTYSGNWVSTDPAVPAVTVLTDDPVTIENSTVAGRGNLIVVTGTAGANLTVRNVSGQGLDPLVAGKQRGAFVVAYIMNALTVQNCTITGTSFGIKTGFSTPSSLSILNNLVTNLEDRASDGNGGFLTARPQLGHFALLYQISAPNGAEIAWNQVMQTMGQSSIDDVITVYKSQGSVSQPINIHDNYMEGYSSPAAAPYLASGLSSTGDSATPVSAYVLFHGNQMVHTAGDGLSLLNGHDITADGNRVVSCGQDSAGTWYSQAGVAAVTLWNRSGASGFTNNTITNTSGGLVIPNTAGKPVPSDTITNPVDLLTPANNVSGNLFTDPCVMMGSLNVGAEDAERAAWPAKLTAHAQTVGDQHSPVQIAISPAGVSLGPSQTQQFKASVSWTSNTGVTWSMSPAAGTLSSTGLYMAPASFATSQAVVITATSAADPSKTASVTVQEIAPVSVAISPNSATIASGQLQPFTASVANTPNTGVAWAISPAIGNISSTGVYSPSPSTASQQIVTVIATSLADNTKSASAMVTIIPAAIAITPSRVSLTATQSQQFGAAFQKGSLNGVFWSISPSVGSISASGLYTAPASITTVQAVTVTAASASNTSQWVTGTITLLPPVKISLVSNYAALTASQTMQLAAAVQNTSNTDVTWSLTPAVGSMSAAGLYTAPATITTQQTVTFTAVSVADPAKSASGNIVLTPPVSVAVVPASATLSPSATQQFAGNVAWSKNTAVTWSLTPAVGTISSSGFYTAPANTSSPQQVTVTATSAADPTKLASAVLTLNPPLSLVVSPAAATVTLGQTQLLTAVVSYANNPGVTWSISPAIGSISASGRYTPPAIALHSPQQVTVTATAVSDAAKSASSVITVNPPASVSLSPAHITLAAAQSQQFTAAVQYSASSLVTWSITPAIGSVTASGLYTAPSSITSVQTVTVTATLVGDASKFDTTLVTLLPPVKVNLLSAYAAITASQTAQFSALVQNTSNGSVLWSISPAFGSITAGGLYIAPQTVTAQQAVTIVATSAADPTKTADGTVVVSPPISINVVPQRVTLPPSGTQQFAGNVAWSNNTAVTWSVSPAVGLLTPGGLYTAPAGTATPQTVIVTATSAADPTKSSSVTVVLNPPPSVITSPANSVITVGQTQLFTASVNYSANTAVTWSISPSIGSISASGRYTPSATPVTTPQTVTVTATSVANPTCSSSVLTTINPPVSLNVLPTMVTLAAAQQQQFAAAVQWTGKSAVTWSITPSVGSITEGGLYTAPASVNSVAQVTVTAVSMADPTKYAVGTIALLPPVKVNLVASYATVAASQSTAFTALVQNAADTRVTWSINPALGSISPSGVYTAPSSISSQQTVTVTASSVADPTKSASGTILVNPAVSVAVVPGVVTLTSSHTVQLTAYVAWNQNTTVTWSMSPNVGTLSSTGLYTAPDNVAANQTVAITATSVADPTKSSTAVISLLTLLGPAPIVITEGGTYSGNWISTDPNTPAVTISTDAPVVIKNSTVQGPGNLIQITGSAGANVSIYNVTGVNTDPNIAGRQRGAFVRAAVVNSLSVSNCTMSGGAFGIQVSSSLVSALTIKGNKGFSLEDRASDGMGGLQAARPQLGHFIVLHNVTAVNNADIGWNELRQVIGQSSTEDVINIYHSQGTSSYPILVHDNYMEGYSSSTTPVYTGNGLISDGDSANISAYIVFQANQMVHTAGGGVAIASGHDVTAIGNRIVSCGTDALGHWYSRTGTAGAALWNYYGAPQFYNNTITQTSGGLVSPSSTGQPVASDLFINAADVQDSRNSVAGNLFTDPCFVDGKIDSSAEDSERTFWLSKQNVNGILVGDQH